MTAGNDRLVGLASRKLVRGRHLPCASSVGWNIDSAYGFIEETTKSEDQQT
jgi:hypothetical protein